MTSPTTAIPPPEQEPSELARFREEWKAELESRRRARATEANAGQASTDTGGSADKVEVPAPGSTPKPVVIPISRPRDQGSRISAISGSHPAVTPDGKVVDQKRAPNLDNALSVYRKAVHHEQLGELDEALLLYRQAFRMDSHVDRAFHREEMLANIAAQQADLKPLATATDMVIATSALSSLDEGTIEDAVTTSLRNLSVKPQTTKTGQALVTGALGDLVASFLEQEVLKFEPEDETQPVVFNLLPEEILVEVIHMLDPTSIERFARVSKKARVMTLESSIWQQLVASTYKEPQVPDMETLAEVIDRYMFDYRRVFIEQPRIRTDGVYIAICHYIRPGLSENHWVNISHLVTYHRYLRFYPNGQVLSLLANEEVGPQSVIPMLKPSLRMKGLYIGTWQLSGTTILISNLFDASGRYLTPATMEHSHSHLHSHSHSGSSSTHTTSSDLQQLRYVFVMSLHIRSKPLGRWNRLDIQSYDTLNLETGDVTPVALKHERPFWFSKVRSYVS